MTKEEAINWLKAISFVSDHRITEAIDMAIESLRADTVSRSQYQGLLNAIGKVYVEVVRCKNCRYAEQRKQMPNQVYCKRDKLAIYGEVRDYDDFCKWGERREK